MPHRWKWFSQTRIKNRALIRQRKANSARALFSSEKRKTQQKRSPASRHLTWYWAFPDCSDFQRIDPSPVRKRTFHGLLFGVEMYCLAKSHAQKCAGYSALWRTDGCDFSGQVRRSKKKSSLAFKTRLLESNVISRIKSAHPIKMCRSDKLGIKEKNKSRKFPSTYFFVPCTVRSAP